MQLRTCGSLFSGGGGWEVGAVAHGIVPVWGVEYDPKIAAVWNENFKPAKCIVSDVRYVDYDALARNAPVDVLFASPECKLVSRARKQTSKEADPAYVCDLGLGQAIAKALLAIRPRLFLLEEATGFVDTPAWDVLKPVFTKLGMAFDYQVLEARRYGVPQIRRRLVARAAGVDRLPNLDPDLPAMSWSDILLPYADAFTDVAWFDFTSGRTEGSEGWQAKGLRLKPPTRWPVYVPAGNKRGTVNDPITGEAVPWAWYGPDEQISAVVRSKGGGAGYIVYGPQGPVKRIPPRGNALLQTFPMNYKLPAGTGQISLAYDIVGAAVPPAVSYHLLQPFLE